MSKDIDTTGSAITPITSVKVFGQTSGGTPGFIVLSSDQIRKITISTDNPSGGTDGDLWFKYTA